MEQANKSQNKIIIVIRLHLQDIFIPVSYLLIFGRGNLIRDVSTGDASSRSGWHRGLTRMDLGGVFGYTEGGRVGGCIRSGYWMILLWILGIWVVVLRWRWGRDIGVGCLRSGCILTPCS